MILDTILKKEHTSKFVCIKVQNEAAMTKVKNDLISSEIHNKLDQSQIGDINGNYDIILDEISKSQNKFITRKLVKSTYKFERPNYRTGRRIAPKFGTHVPIDTLTLIG